VFVENPDKSGQSPARLISNGVLVGRAKKLLGALG
jgi:hypothetical protein